MRVTSIVGARPQFVKLAPMASAFAAADIEHVIVHTGQHYDTEMSDAFFEGLSIPSPDYNLAVGSGTHGKQTGQMLSAIESVLEANRPDWVLVYGDTNSTLAATVAAVKLQIPTAHLEAGLRSFNRSMPEEVNRVLTDHASDLLLVPTDTASENLRREGLDSRAVMVGDVMADLCLSLFSGDPDTGAAQTDPYVVATIHRPSNTEDPDQLARIIRALSAIPGRVLLLAHPRLVSAAHRCELSLELGSINLMSPQPYIETMQLVRHAAGVVTDSGGLQKEAFLLGTPCLTVRSETEWLETLTGGWNLLDPTATDLVQHAIRPRPEQKQSTPFGDGHAAEKVVAALLQRTAIDTSQSVNSE